MKWFWNKQPLETSIINYDSLWSIAVANAMKDAFNGHIAGTWLTPQTLIALNYLSDEARHEILTAIVRGINAEQTIEWLNNKIKQNEEWGDPEQRCLWGELENEFGLNAEDMDCAADVKDAMVFVLEEKNEQICRLVEENVSCWRHIQELQQALFNRRIQGVDMIIDTLELKRLREAPKVFKEEFALELEEDEHICPEDMLGWLSNFVSEHGCFTCEFEHVADDDEPCVSCGWVTEDMIDRTHWVQPQEW